MEFTVEQKLKSLWDLQTIHSKIDQIHILRGELPIEVADLEDEIAGLETRISKLERDLEDLTDALNTRNNNITENHNIIKKYESQLDNVKNVREYDTLKKEIELAGLDIQLNEKKIREVQNEIQHKRQNLDSTVLTLEDYKKNLETKRDELNKIIEETKKDEIVLEQEAEKATSIVEERLLTAYTRLRASVKNGLAVVSIDRGSCSGCFNKIPPQRQADIRQRKKIIVCEHCGRVIVDESFTVTE